MGIRTVIYLAFLVLATMADCTQELFGALANPGLLAGMIMNTGKGINDLGDFEGCEANSQLHYATFQLQGQGFAAYLGTCVPKNWTIEDLKIIQDSLTKLINDPKIKVNVKIPSESKPSPSAGHILGLICFSLLILTSMLGVITEYSPLFNLPNASSDKLEDNKTKLGLLFLSFSFTRNVTKIFWGPKQKEDDYLSVLNGVRVICLLYVMFGHGYSSILESPVSEIIGIERLMTPWMFSIVPGGFFAVDVFFFLSAFLGAYLMLVKFFKRRMNFGLIYFHRIYRLVIPIGLVIALLLTVYVYLGNGPVWYFVTDKWIDGWLEQWWQAVLFVSNLFPWTENSKCIGWLWYIPNDMQFFLFLPFQILWYKQHRFLGYALTYVILFGSCLTSFLISTINSSNISLVSDPSYWNTFYVRPWTRIAAYEVGVLFGMWYFEWMNKDKHRIFSNSIGTKFFQTVHYFKIVRYPLYVFGAGMITLLVLLQHSEGRYVINKRVVNPQIVHDLFNAFARPLYVLSVMCLLSGALTGKGSLVRYLLGSQEWSPWARLSFMTYLIHLLVFGLYYNQIRQSVDLFNKQIMFIMVACMLVAYVIAIPLSALFEAPFMQIEKHFIFRRNDEHKQEKGGKLRIN